MTPTSPRSLSVQHYHQLHQHHSVDSEDASCTESPLSESPLSRSPSAPMAPSAVFLNRDISSVRFLASMELVHRHSSQMAFTADMRIAWADSEFALLHSLPMGFYHNSGSEPDWSQKVGG